MYKNINFGPTNTIKTQLGNGAIHLKLEQKLGELPIKITEKLVYWAKHRPNQAFICKNVDGEWQKVSYAETYSKVQSIAQYLLNLDFKEGETIAILSDNSLEHAFLALAAMHIGIPYSPISPAYSLISSDFGKLKHCLEALTPKLIFAQNATVFEKAIEFVKGVLPEAIIIIAEGFGGIHFVELLENQSNEAVLEAYNRVNEESIAKILFTSGSTGLPKGVINTNKMWCSNLQQITQVFPFMQTEAPIFLDWLPWNHTFGGNHNFGLALFNGGTFYIDEGKPTEKGIKKTIQNLKEIAPTAYFNVPKGFEVLIPYLENDQQLRENFFKNLNIIFYAGASLSQPIWDKLEELSLNTIGVKIPIITGLGCTESGPSAMFANWGGAFSGLLGVPVAGMELKLVPDGDKMEVRYKAPNITIGYWRNEVETLKAFDEDGYYKTGDAVKFVDENDPNKGLIFDGRIAEDFKLSTGTWVNVGVLKSKVISTGAPIIQDVVLTGLDKEYVGAILFLNAEACKKMAQLSENEKSIELFENVVIKNYLENWHNTFNQNATGSSTFIKKYVIAIEPPSIDLGEITDKGSLNQRAVLKHRANLVNQIYLNK